MSDNPCRCGAPLPQNAYVCPTCTRTLADDLTHAADHLRWIDDKRAQRRSRMWVGGHIASAETPLPYDTRVSRVLEPIRNSLTTWARLTIQEHACRDLPNPRDTKRVDQIRRELAAWDRLADDITAGKIAVNGDARGIASVRETLREDLQTAMTSIDLHNLAEVAVWLADHTEWIAARPWAIEILDDALTARESLDRLMDNPPTPIPLGACDHEGCTHPLVAPEGVTEVACPHCGWKHDITERRLELLKQADDLTVTVKEANRLLRLAGHDIDPRTIYALIRHFGLVPVLSVRLPGGKKPSSIYRLGAIREAVEFYASDPETRRDVRSARTSVA